ncbi:HORMA domain-containing protein 1-like [Macrosteles quadrilineatus]|uniref:HORMA domain-containing protein 1-like n=1 Tax=Macrosteles quadrilineatus TaxID=74068 RepID=UPI0023E16AD8|nr:HORMA domain-containing protein 1-like [Macrosteles quadrilineatus]
MVKYRKKTQPSQKQVVRETVQEFILENPNISVGKSIEFMKKLMVVSVSSIAYLRGIFPASAFAEKRLAGQPVHVLKGTEEAPEVKTLIEYIRGSFDLVHSQHLKKFIFLIQKELVTLETYTFSFVYNHDTIACDVLGEVDGKEVIHEQNLGLPDEIEKSVRQLVRCILTHAVTLHPLPTNFSLTVKLQVDDDTPEEILPNFLQLAAEDEIKFPGEVETLKLGKVETKYMTFGLVSKSTLQEGPYQEAGVNQEENLMPQDDLEDEVMPSQEETLHTSITKINLIDESKAVEKRPNTPNPLVNNLPDPMEFKPSQSPDFIDSFDKSDDSFIILQFLECDATSVDIKKKG